MTYYPEADSHIRYKVKKLLDSWNYATKKELQDKAGFNTSNVAAKRYFITLKAKVDKVDIDKLKSVPNGFTNF